MLKSRMSLVSRTLSSSAMGVVMLAGFALPGTAAQAQTSQDDPAAQAEPESAQDDNTIVVTGFRGSLKEAQDIKRDAVNVVDSIVAEDIAKMPDLNIAESIQRIPGVAVSREGGEGRNITLRGFAPDFTRTTLNGMEVPASSDGLDSGGFTINSGRSFDFHIFASELFNSIVVNKTASAALDEGSLGAVIDLNTGNPLSYGAGLKLVGSAQARYNDLNDDLAPRVAGLLGQALPTAIRLRPVPQPISSTAPPAGTSRSAISPSRPSR